MRVLIPERNVHVVNEGTTYTKKLEANKNSEKSEENNPIKWKSNVSPHYRENCVLLGGVSSQFDDSASVFDIYEQVINLDVLIEILVQQCNLYLQQNERSFLANAEKIKVFIGFNYIMAVNPKFRITLAFRISLREQDIKKSYQIFTLPTTRNKKIQIKAIRLDHRSLE